MLNIIQTAVCSVLGEITLMVTTDVIVMERECASMATGTLPLTALSVYQPLDAVRDAYI